MYFLVESFSLALRTVTVLHAHSFKFNRFQKFDKSTVPLSSYNQSDEMVADPVLAAVSIFSFRTSSLLFLARRF